MAANVLLDQQGRRVLNANGQQQAGNCCFANAVTCAGGTPTNLWMTTANTIGIAAFKYLGTCYTFSGAPLPCLPSGAILLTPAQVQTFASCAACAPGQPCANCANGTGPNTFTVSFTSFTSCIGQCMNDGASQWGKWSGGIPGGPWDVLRTGACVYRAFIPFAGLHFDRFNTVGGPNQCTGTPTFSADSESITIQVSLAGDNIGVIVQAAASGGTFGGPNGILFQQTLPLIAPYDCAAQRLLTNGVNNCSYGFGPCKDGNVLLTPN